MPFGVNIAHLLGMLAERTPQCSGWPKLSWTTMSKPERNLSTCLGRPEGQAAGPKEHARKAALGPNPKASRYRLTTAVLASEVRHCANLDVDVAGDEVLIGEEIPAALTAEVDADLREGTLPRRCFSLSVEDDQSRNMRCNPDMFLLSSLSR